MKKIIMAAAVVCAAAVVQAAAVGWSGAGATAFKGCDYSIFVIGLNEVSGVEQIKAIVADGGLAAADSYAFASGYTVNAANGGTSVTLANSGKSITYSGSGEDIYEAFLVYHDAANDKASYSSIAKITMMNDDNGKTWSFGNQATNIANNMFDVGNIPEPSSALLMLLGMAGLALRRKQK